MPFTCSPAPGDGPSRQRIAVRVILLTREPQDSSGNRDDFTRKDRQRDESNAETGLASALLDAVELTRRKIE